MELQSFVAIPNVAYLGAAILFILSLGGLSNQETARRGNSYGLVGMVIAIGATILLLVVPDSYGATRVISSDNWTLLITTALVGGVIGSVMAKRVAMTAMPQLVALLHSFVGLAAVLVGISTWLTADLAGHGSDLVHLLEIWFGVAIGAITFISDPIRAQVALFEGVNGDAPCACNFNRMGVNGAGVAIKHDIGDGVVLKQGRKARGPCL